MSLYITLDQDTNITREDSTAVPLGHLPIRAGEKNEKGEIQESASETTNLEEYSWFHGNISRAEAERRLDGCIPGSYLVRESQSKPGKYSISFRDDTHTGHYLIHKDSVISKWFVHPGLRFNNLPDMMTHHSKDADGLSTVLHYPAPKPEVNPAPNSEEDDWEIDRSDVTIGPKLHGEIFEIFDALIKSKGISVFARPFKPVSSICFCIHVQDASIELALPCAKPMLQFLALISIMTRLILDHSLVVLHGF